MTAVRAKIFFFVRFIPRSEIYSGMSARQLFRFGIKYLAVYRQAKAQWLGNRFQLGHRRHGSEDDWNAADQPADSIDDLCRGLCPFTRWG